jgi:hypothetical protein
MAAADAGIPMIAFSYPIVLLLFLPIVLIEAAYIRSKTMTSWRTTLIVAGKANLVTTLLGFPVAWMLMFLFEMAAGLFLSPLRDNFPHFDAVLGSVPGRVLMGILSSAWLGPTNSKIAITAAFVFLFVPAFVLSGWIESKMVVADLNPDDFATVKSTVWKANVVSYLFLAVVGAAILQYPLSK